MMDPKEYNDNELDHELNQLNDNEQNYIDNSVVIANKILPDVIPILPLKDRPVFPGIMHPVIVSGEEQTKLIKKLMKSENRFVGLNLYRGDADVDVKLIAPADICEVGVIGKIIQVTPTETGSYHVLINTLERFQIMEYLNDQYPFRVRVKYWYEESFKNDEEIKAYSVSIINTIRELIKLNPLFKEELTLLIGKKGIEEPGTLADYSALMTTASKDELQDLLETRNIRARVEKALLLLKKELEISKTQKVINKRIEEKMSKQQREFFLKQQLQEIKKELGLSKDEKDSEFEKFQERAKKLSFTEEAQERFNEELEKIQLLEPSSPEFAVARNYLDLFTQLPWGVKTQDHFDILQAKQVLDQDHFGLEDVKDRILEFLAVGKKKNGLSGTIILLVGPPGVGKTSIGKSIARALGRKFYRFSLGGMRDEAEIKGHRRTYIGAQPGKLIQALKSAKSCNPVILLDEIDKVGKSFQGDPASALLEVLDPEQNKDFLDHFLDVRFDLSNVLFICTANQLETIPGPLRDRMEIIPISGYVMQEKLEIAKRFLLPKLTEQNGVVGEFPALNDQTLTTLIDDYARESGVRSLEKVLNKLIRKYVKASLEVELDPKKAQMPQITPTNLKDFVGAPLFREENYFKKPQVGVVTGLAYTSVGGATLNIEASAVASKNGGFKQTGQLGKVMVESSEIAYSYIRSLISTEGSANEKEFFDNSTIHLHVPAGATPKDGPSAGITMACALYSLVKQRSIRENIAMTGELSLTGLVMPIGGVKEKLLAAKRSNISHIIFPEANRSDFEELKDYVKSGVVPFFVKDFSEVLKICFN